MQRVNVCLQALLKRLRNACREHERGGRRKRAVGLWQETLVKGKREGVPVLSVTDDSRGYVAGGAT